MKVSELMEALNLKLLTEDVALDGEVKGGYASDLLSNVMGQAEPDMVWVTMQGHQNIAAVASLIGLSAAQSSRWQSRSFPAATRSACQPNP